MPDMKTFENITTLTSVDWAARSDIHTTLTQKTHEPWYISKIIELKESVWIRDIVICLSDKFESHTFT